MSNLTIIENIEKNLRKLEANPSAAKEFAQSLNDNIEALEGIPYTVIQEMRDYQYQIEIAGFAEEDDCISDLATVIGNLREWLENTKNEYGGINKPSIKK